MNRTLYLVRHGETALNATGAYCGRLDPPLAVAGERQADALAARLAALVTPTIHASPSARTRSTAERIAAAHDAPIATHPELCEIDFGAWEGKTWRECARDDPERWSALVADAASFRFPGGETPDELYARVDRYLAALPHDDPSPLVIVSHLGPLRALLARLLGLAPADGWHYRIAAGGHARVRVDDGYGVLEALWEP